MTTQQPAPKSGHDKWFAEEYPELWPHVAAGEIGSALDVWSHSWNAWQAALSQRAPISDVEILKAAKQYARDFALQSQNNTPDATRRADRSLADLTALLFAQGDVHDAAPREWVESEQSMRGAPLRAVLASSCVTVIWHSKKPVTSNPVWEVIGNDLC
jgi:hypothetical protein